MLQRTRGMLSWLMSKCLVRNAMWQYPYWNIQLMDQLSKRRWGQHFNTTRHQQDSSTVLEVFPRFLNTPGLVRNLCLINLFLKWTMITQGIYFQLLKHEKIGSSLVDGLISGRGLKDLRCFSCRLTKTSPWYLLMSMLKTSVQQNSYESGKHVSFSL